MTVDVKCDRDGAVPKLIADVPDGVPSEKSDRRVGVSEIMDANLTDVCPTETRMKCFPQSVAVNRCASLCSEYSIWNLFSCLQR